MQDAKFYKSEKMAWYRLQHAGTDCELRPVTITIGEEIIF